MLNVNVWILIILSSYVTIEVSTYLPTCSSLFSRPSAQSSKVKIFSGPSNYLFSIYEFTWEIDQSRNSSLQLGLSAKSKGGLFLKGPFNSLGAPLKLTKAYISHYQ